MFSAYCRNPADGSWTPPVARATAEACDRYCALHHHWAPAMRLCDDDDFVGLHGAAPVLKCPMPDGTRRETRR